MTRSHFLLLALLSLALPSAVAARKVDTLPPTQVSGTVIGYDATSTLLNVLTRLGAKSFLVTNTTIILLNNHSAAVASIQAGDEVTVTYDYPTFTALKIHLFRESKATGTIKSVSTSSSTASTFVVKLSGGGQTTVTSNANSVVNLDDITIATPSVLVGRTADLIFEPGTNNLLLSMNAHSPEFNGRISAVDPTGATVTVQGNQTITFPVSTGATILRNGTTTTLSTLVVGDRVKVAWVKTDTGRSALAIQATAAH